MVEHKETQNTVWLSPLVPDGEFHLQFRDDHVHVTLGKGFRSNVEKGARLWQALREVCEKHGTRRVLVEGYIPAGERNTSEIVQAGKRTATVPRLWMALCFKDFKPDDQSELYEAIAASNGVRVKHFDDAGKASAWLRNNTKA